MNENLKKQFHKFMVEKLKGELTEEEKKILKFRIGTGRTINNLSALDQEKVKVQRQILKSLYSKGYPLRAIAEISNFSHERINQLIN